jgi:hypothetical protein
MPSRSRSQVHCHAVAVAHSVKSCAAMVVFSVYHQSSLGHSTLIFIFALLRIDPHCCAIACQSSSCADEKSSNTAALRMSSLLQHVHGIIIFVVSWRAYLH